MPSLPAQKNVLLLLAKNSSKTEIKLFPYCTISHETRVNLKHYVNDCRSATAKGWEKEVFQKIRSFVNLKCNKGSTLKSFKKCLKSNFIKSELVQKDFSSILLKLQVTFVDPPKIVRTAVSKNTS